MRREVVGARYGVGDWLIQRVSGTIIAVYVVVAAALLATKGSTYPAWKSIFTHGGMRVATLLFSFALAWHVWVGMRDVLMDYIRQTGVRLFLEVTVIVSLATYVAWIAHVLWR